MSGSAVGRAGSGQRSKGRCSSRSLERARGPPLVDSDPDPRRLFRAAGVRLVPGLRAPEGTGRARHGYGSGLCGSQEAPSPPLERALLPGSGWLTHLCNYPEAAEELC